MELHDLSHHRSKKRIKELGEVFTQEKYVYQMLDMLDKSVWADEKQVFFEPTCGHGNFVISIVEKRLDAFLKKAKRKSIKDPIFYSIANTMNNLWAIDVDKYNVKVCRKRAWNKIIDFFIEYNKFDSFSTSIVKNKDFWTHVICCIKWQIQENDMFSCLEDDIQKAKLESSKTIVSKKWFKKNGHHPIDFYLSWCEYFNALKDTDITPLEFKRGLRFLESSLSGTKISYSQEFNFAYFPKVSMSKQELSEVV